MLAPLAELERLLPPAAMHATVVEGRSLVRNAALRIQELGEWAKGKAGDDFPELSASHVSQVAHNSSSELTESAQLQALLVSFLNATLEACADLVGSSIAQRVFETCFPRLSYRPAIREEWKVGEDAVLLAFVSLHDKWPESEAQMKINHRTHITVWAAISMLSALSLPWRR
jgi:hypothetical protein